MSDGDDFSELLRDHEVKRESTKTESNGGKRDRQCYNWAPSRRCKFGLQCREKKFCSYYHGPEGRDIAIDYCTCESLDCPKPHPNRRHEVARVGAKRAKYVCKKCGGDHLVTYCPELVCNKCGGKHLVTRCPELDRKECRWCRRWDHKPGEKCPYR